MFTAKWELDLANFEAVKFVKGLARKFNSAALAQLANRMAAEARLSAAAEGGAQEEAAGAHRQAAGVDLTLPLTVTLTLTLTLTLTHHPNPKLTLTLTPTLTRCG